MKLELSYTTDNHDKTKKALFLYIPILFGSGFIVFATEFITRYVLDEIAKNTIKELRSRLYCSLIKQPLEFFDHKEHSIGNLTSLLASEIKNITGISVEAYIGIYQGCAGFVAAVLLSFWYFWPIAI